jgi:hypothetical protein
MPDHRTDDDEKVKLILQELVEVKRKKYFLMHNHSTTKNKR